MGLCIIVLVVNEWHNIGPQYLVTLSLCIQIAIDKMQWCLLSEAYAFPHHNPTMENSVHNVDISKPLTHMTPYCPVQLKPVQFNLWRADFSSMQVDIEGEHGYDSELQSDQDHCEELDVEVQGWRDYK